MSDPWDAFGDDEEDDDSEECEEGRSSSLQASVVPFLTQQFVKQNPQISLNKRIVATTHEGFKQDLQIRNIQVLSDDGPCDAAFETDDSASRLRQHVVPGGYLILQAKGKEVVSQELNSAVWNTQNASILFQGDDEQQIWAVQRFACPINSTSCPWKPKTNLVDGEKVTCDDQERVLLHDATITLSAYEQRNQMLLTQHSISRAVESLQNNGYCIVRSILNHEKCLAWGKAIMGDLHQAAQLLLTRDDIDIFNPLESKNEPQSYREMSMREDLRMDLRDGPQIRRLRDWEATECQLDEELDLHNAAIVAHTSTESCLRFHPTVIEIVQKTMNPTDPKLSGGNFGRYNFSGSGPDGSPQPMRIGPMGGIISLPSSADQAIHADTPHLFETMDCLPAHYINAFCLGTDQIDVQRDADGLSTGATGVGGTAFVHASHKLSFTANLAPDWTVSTEPKVWRNIVRPSLALGDLVLFDCRILHFGLANTDTTVERPMLYTNMTQGWFHDPKNWDDHQHIFPPQHQQHDDDDK